MARKVIIDCDPGIADAVALCLALFEPELDVQALTAVAGGVPADQSSRNVQAVVEQLDPPRYPRMGEASDPDGKPYTNGRALNGDDGLGNAGVVTSRLQHRHPSEKILIDEVRAAPDEITILCLGPLTNLARAFQRDPQLPALVGRIIMCGGAVTAPGDITAPAEFNMYFDPFSARAVFQSATTKTLVPLDVTRKISFPLDLIDELPDASTAAGSLLRRILPFSYRAHRQVMGRESIYLSSSVALAAAVHPELFETRDMAGDVEVKGELTIGTTVFDRRHTPAWRTNMEVAVKVDQPAVSDFIRRGLKRAGSS